ncbi:MAG: hypothetical protein Q8M76_19830, partial [Spirochaetaceae bacterium]|nr:hypothetical protein [Spirochaetaceae bacterium]
MKKFTLALFAACVIIGSAGVFGVLDGPFLGMEYHASDGAWTIASVASGSPASAAGVPAGARLVELAGVAIGPWDLTDDFDTIPDRASLISALATQKVFCSAIRPGRPIRIVYESPEGTIAEATLIPSAMPVGFALARLARLFLPAIFCLAIGLAVILKRPGDRRAQIFSIMLAVASLVFVTFGSWTSRDTAMNPYIFFTLFAINDFFAFIYFPVFFLRFCLSFPRDLKPAKNRSIIAGLYLSPILVMALFLPRIAFEIQQIFWGGCLLGGAAVMVRQYFSLRSAVLRAQVKWILWGSMIFGIFMVATYTLPILSRTAESGDWLAPSLVFLVVPLTFAFAVLRYRLMDIDSLFDATFIYTITIVVLFGLDACAAFGIGMLRGNALRDIDLLISFVGILVVIFLYIPVRSRVERLVKRIFRRELYESGAVA